MASFAEILMGSPQRITQTPRLSPQQLMGQNQLLQQALSGLQGNQFNFEPIAQQARTQFQQKTIPSILDRFSQGRNSGALAQALAQAGSGLEEGLAGLQSQYNLQREGLFQNRAQLGLQPQFENVINPATTGLLQALLPSLLGVGGQALGGYLSRPQLGTQASDQGGSQGNLLMKLLPFLL